MNEVLITGNTLPEAYHSALLALDHEGEITESVFWKQKCREMGQTIYIKNPVQEPRISKLIIGGFHELQQYEMEILEGILNFRIGNGWDYTYNDRIRNKKVILSDNSQFYLDQIDFVITELKNDPTSRRAVVSVRDDRVDPFTKDPACLQHLQLFVRKGKLDCSVLFRSNDLPEAFFFNAWAFIRLQEKVAERLGIEVGTYTHRSNSMHVYEKDFKLIQGFVKKLESGDRDLYYCYKDEWKELMEGEIPSIMEQVKKLGREPIE